MNKVFVLLLFISILYSCTQENKDEHSTILKEFRLILNENDLQAIYKNPRKDNYIPVKVVYKSDTVKAKMRIRGDSSRGYGKKSLKIVFKKDALLQGEKRKINLNSEWTDKTYIRQYLSSYLMNEANVNSFKTNFVTLYVNNKFFGIYLQVENIDSKFLTDRGLDENANMYKAKVDGACLSIYDNVNELWEKKSNKNTDWQDLKLLIKQLDTIKNKNYYSFLKQNFEYDKLITLTVMNMLIQNGSTYYHNYYMYHDIYGSGKWQVLPWDMDKSMSYYNWEPYVYTESTNKWLSDNPLFEKMFINDEIRTDILKKLDSLEKTIFNNKKLNPIIDTLYKVLKPYIALDTTDQIKNENEWEQAIFREKDFVYKQVKYIRNQLTTFPIGFEVKRINDIQISPPVLRWNSSKSPTGKKITYTVYYSTDYLFEDKNQTRIVENLTDTFFVIPKTIGFGKYYWKIIATDGMNSIDGYNRFNYFNYKAPTEIKNNISKNTIWTKEKSPYFILKKINVPKGLTLTIEKGVYIILKESAGIYVHGNIDMRGTKTEHINIKPFANEWGEIYLTNATAKINYTNFHEGVFRAKGSKVEINNTQFFIDKKNLLYDGFRQAVIWINGGEYTLKNSKLFGNGLGEGMNINRAKTIISNSYFNNLPDAIEVMTVDNAHIYRNFIENSPDDAIDMNGCRNVLVENNYIINNNDKAVSIGTEEYGPSTGAIIRNNLIIGNGTAFSAKDSSDAFVYNNTLIENNTGLVAYLKNNRKHYSVGGTIKAEKTVFYNSQIIDMKIGDNSEIKVQSSISNKSDIAGKENIKAEISFVNKERKNYFLSPQTLENTKQLEIGCYGKDDRFIDIEKENTHIVLYNPNLFSVNISGFTLIVGTKKYKLPRYVLNANEKIFIAKSTKKLLKKTNNRLVEYKTLNIEKTKITLLDNLQNIIDEINN